MSDHYVFNIRNLTKHYGKREILKDINLNFYPGAKIGVIGSQRVRQDHAAPHHGRRGQGVHGRGVAAPGRHHRLRPAGAAPHARQDRPRERRGGRRPHPRLLQPTGRNRRRDGHRRREAVREIVERDGARAGPDRCDQRLRTRPHARDGDGRDAPAAVGRARRAAVRRRAAARRPVQDAPPAHRPAAARRADQPPRRRERRVARTPPRGVPRGGGRGHARPLLPRQRREVDSGTGRRPRVPVQRQLLRRGWSQKQKRLAVEEKQESAKQKQLERELEWATQLAAGAHEPRARPGSRPSTSCKSR